MVTASDFLLQETFFQAHLRDRKQTPLSEMITKQRVPKRKNSVGKLKVLALRDYDKTQNKVTLSNICVR